MQKAAKNAGVRAMDDIREKVRQAYTEAITSVSNGGVDISDMTVGNYSDEDARETGAVSFDCGDPVRAAMLKEGERVLDLGKYHARLLIPYSDGSVLELLHREASVTRIEYEPEGVSVDAAIKPELWGRVRDFAVWSDVPDPREEWER